MARRLATVVNQAPAFDGMPLSRQFDKALEYASCTHSSARSISPVTLIVAASTAAHS
ncbi:MAG: hypothetical protein WA786_07655 [Acidimicrobiales bacterium]